MARVADANHHIAELNQLYLATVQTLAAAIDAKDQVTHGHIKRVQNYARELAVAVGIKNDIQLKAIQAAAVLHDTGKIAIPEAILNKPGPLTTDEFEVMKQHAPWVLTSSRRSTFLILSNRSCAITMRIGTALDTLTALMGTDIPMGARILAVVDCFDALTSDRPYRLRLSEREAIEILLRQAWKHVRSVGGRCLPASSSSSWSHPFSRPTRAKIGLSSECCALSLSRTNSQLNCLRPRV